MWETGEMGKLKKTSRFAVLTAALLPIGLTPLPDTAFGQEADDGTIEEIMVTARKREEGLQEIPESMTVFTAEVLETANVESVRDFVDLTPNMIIRETFRSNESFVTMRGIASAQGALPPVAIVIDGVQVGSNDFLNQDLLDVERIEVLRGPQGALYGQGAIAGAINIVTAAPTDEFDAFVKGTYGTAGTYRIAGAVSGPLVDDRLYGRVSAYYRNSDGLIKNSRGERISFDEEYSVRGSLVYRGDRLSAAARLSTTRGDGSCCIQDRIRRDANGIPIDIDDVTNPGASSNVIGTDENDFDDASLKIDYDFGGVTLTSITGVAEVRQDIFADLDFSATPNQIQDVGFYVDVINQELRLVSDGDSAFRWVFGGFYQDREEVLDVAVLGDVPAPPRPLLFGFIQHKNSTMWALFGQADYDLSDSLQLTAALRYDKDEQDSFNSSLADPYAEATFDELQPKIQLSYSWTEDVMAYATWSKGFRTGGFSQTSKFDNEVATNSEIGFKASLLNGLMTVNASLFHVDYENQQLSFVVLDPDDATNTLRGVLNIPKTDINGFELEVAARPADGLDISLGVGVADTSIASVDSTSPFASPEAIGKVSPLAPSLTFNIGATYVRPVSDRLEMLLHVNYRQRGGYYFDLNNTLKTGTGDFINAKAAFSGESWSIGVFGRNMTDTRRATNVSITGSDLRVPNQPRSYGVEATYRF